MAFAVTNLIDLWQIKKKIVVAGENADGKRWWETVRPLSQYYHSVTSTMHVILP